MKCRNCSRCLHSEDRYQMVNEFGYRDYSCVDCVNYWWMAGHEPAFVKVAKVKEEARVIETSAATVVSW